jgi:hypothetical protein
LKIFHCGHCGQLVFFENTECIKCGRVIAYLPDRDEMAALEPDGDGRWRALAQTSAGKPSKNDRAYRRCVNDTNEHVCNWAVPGDDPQPYCRSCRLTRVIPNLEQPGHHALWAKVEAAKRRLIQTLLALGLPVVSKTDDPERGLAFEFLADPEDPNAPHVLTGHENGVITLNIAEADDAEREKRRLAMKEGYRTLLGHFRHEIGHYYWDRLVRDSKWIDDFRRLFGDDRRDYGEALKAHHANGAPADWTTRFVSAYASSHPWEDWAETWAHSMHMTDTLETAVACGLSLRPKRPDEPTLEPDVPVGRRSSSFDALIERWFPLTLVLNNLNRGMGLPDAYPFVLSTPALDKLRFVHELVAGAKRDR